MKKSLNIYINILFFVLTFLFIFINNPIKNCLITINNLFLLIGLFILIHFIKFLRQYLLLIESGIHSGEFLKLYVKTTFCSIVLPYKVGELYKAYEYGYKVNNYIKGFLTVIVDKMLDGIVLLFVFIPYEIQKNNSLSIVTWILLMFVISFIIIYVSFNTTYYYLNKHFIKKNNDIRNILALRIIEQIHDLYIYVNGLIKGRMLLLFIFTILAWTFEWLFMYVLSGGNFIEYINAMFLGNQNSIFSNYLIIGMICFIFSEILFLFRKCGSNK